MDNQTYLMVVTPHPDDAEFGVAGTVARLTREGKKVVYVVCTNGDKGTSDRKVKPEELAKIREQEQMAAAKLLGVSDVVFLRYPDQSLEDSDEFRKELVRVIRLYQPYAVVTADPYRKYMWHRDHRIAGQVTLDAVFPYARDYLSYPELLDEGLEPHKVREMWFWASDDINYRLDITDTFDTKLTALGCHKSQVSDIPPEMRERMRDWARMNAEGEDFELAEAFHRIEMRY
ncbi:MAG: PIG-L family deacetylase [Dehalococcoidales bacterium]|nr:PIG-L family deacetylase [Dehalococcoidales bacterium]